MPRLSHSSNPDMNAPSSSALTTHSSTAQSSQSFTKMPNCLANVKLVQITEKCSTDISLMPARLNHRYSSRPAAPLGPCSCSRCYMLRSCPCCPRVLVRARVSGCRSWVCVSVGFPPVFVLGFARHFFCAHFLFGFVFGFVFDSGWLVQRVISFWMLRW